MAKYTCPYCFTEHTLSEVEFLCVNTFCSEKVQDEQYANYLGMKNESMKMTNAIFPSKAKALFLMKNAFMPVWEACPYCKTKSSVRVCPSCHNELPEGIQDHEDMIIAIVGSHDAGKTHFISVLINELQNRICPDVFKGTFIPMNEYGNHCRDVFYDKIYRQKKLLSSSCNWYVNKECSVEKPWIYEMMIPLNKKADKVRKMTFVFWDTVGGTWIDEATMKMRRRYISKASGIIFLLDPMQIMELRLNMDDEEIKRSSSINEGEIEPQEMVLQRISKLIREEKGMSKKQKINIPTAIAFSKFDVLKRFFPKGSIVLEPSSYLREGQFDKNEWFTVSSEIDAMLKEWGPSGFTRNVDMNFSKYTYCALSALGQQPFITYEGKTLKSMPMPHRVEDPFLWILKENGIIKNGKGC